jgi:phage terminase large subunit
MTEFIRAPKANRFVNPRVAKVPDLIATPQHTTVPLPNLTEIGERYRLDPLHFVLDTFTWQEGDGLEPWQHEVLAQIGEELHDGEPVHRFAICSGKGAGKTALCAQLFLWHVACHEGRSQTVATSVTGFQTTSRLWREIRIWRNRWTLRQHFTIHSSRLEHIKEDTWFGQNQTWSIDRPEAFQGTHERYTGFFVDEASGVPDVILETIESGATDSSVIIVYISNATRSKGRFRECFRRYAEWWATWNIDTRNVKRVSRASIDKALSEANNDVEATSFRRDVRGEFPLEDYDQVIPEWIIQETVSREPAPLRLGVPLYIGCDIARKGANKTVFTVRQETTIVHREVYNKQEIDVTADRLMDLMDHYNSYQLHVFVDADGLGVGVIDNCTRGRNGRSYRVSPVNSAQTAIRHERYANKRAEMWYACREWLHKEACLSKEDTALHDQLTDIYYRHDNQNRVLIESKEEMIARGVSSPDLADSLVYTFAGNVLRRAGAW